MHNLNFLSYDCAVLILHSSWQEIKLGTQSSMGIINPRWQRMHDNYKQNLCHSPRGKQLQGWQAMLNMNMDHRTKDLVTDATPVLLELAQKQVVVVTWMKKKNTSLDWVRWRTFLINVVNTPGITLHHLCTLVNSKQTQKKWKPLYRQQQPKYANVSLSSL